MHNRIVDKLLGGGARRADIRSIVMPSSGHIPDPDHDHRRGVDREAEHLVRHECESFSLSNQKNSQSRPSRSYRVRDEHSLLQSAALDTMSLSSDDLQDQFRAASILANSDGRHGASIASSDILIIASQENVTKSLGARSSRDTRFFWGAGESAVCNLRSIRATVFSPRQRDRRPWLSGSGRTEASFSGREFFCCRSLFSVRPAFSITQARPTIP